MNVYSRAVAFRITCDRALFLELEILSQREDVTMIGSSKMSPTEERKVGIEAYGEGYRLAMELLKRFEAKEKKR